MRVLLVREREPVGRVFGQVRLGDGGLPGTRKRLRVEREAESAVVVRVITERDGSFAVDLPAGRYRVAVDQRGAEPRKAQAIEVANAANTRVDLVAPRVTGQVVPATPERVQSAGRGSRRGAWRTYAVADGLPAASITAIVQDRQGELWLGTDGGGLVRFDEGKTWEPLGADQGYSGTYLNALQEDRQGQIWLGTVSGLLRFREGRFENFGTATGLQDESVLAILEDREGRLWIGVEGGGLRVLDPAWTPPTSAEGPAKRAITSLANWGEEVAVGTKNGLYRATASSITECPLLRGEWVLALKPDDRGQCLVVANEKTLLWLDGSAKCPERPKGLKC